MKTKIYIHFATIILIGILGASAEAQSRNRQQLRFDVPFAFNVGNVVLPAGAYDVRIVNPSADRSVLQIRGVDGRMAMMVQTTDIVGWATAKGRLGFRHYGDRYFLAQVWMASESTGLAMPRSRAESLLRRQLGKANKNLDLVEVKG